MHGLDVADGRFSKKLDKSIGAESEHDLINKNTKLHGILMFYFLLLTLYSMEAFKRIYITHTVLKLLVLNFLKGLGCSLLVQKNLKLESGMLIAEEFC